MSAIPLRAYATSGMVDVATVNSLITFGEPMLSETPAEPGYNRTFRAWIRLRGGGRVFGPIQSSAPGAAFALLAKLRAEEAKGRAL